MPNILTVIVVEYFTGFTVTSAWMAYALGRYPTFRGRHDRVVGLLGWPWGPLAAAFGWPITVIVIAVFGIPDEEA